MGKADFSEPLSPILGTAMKEGAEECNLQCGQVMNWESGDEASDKELFTCPKVQDKRQAVTSTQFGAVTSKISACAVGLEGVPHHVVQIPRNSVDKDQRMEAFQESKDENTKTGVKDPAPTSRMIHSLVPLQQPQSRKMGVSKRGFGERASPLKERKLNSSFDRCPKWDEQPSVQYKYQNAPIRKKADRKRLKGFTCTQCSQAHHAILGLEGNDEKYHEIIQRVSRHRSKFGRRVKTPPHFYEPGWVDHNLK